MPTASPSYDHPLTPIPVTYVVTPVHPDDRLDAPARMHLELRARPGNRWVVSNAFNEALGRDGQWSHLDCSDEWRDAHWFDFDEATQIAQAEVRRKVAEYQGWLARRAAQTA